jgi:hypothetical protein
MEKRLFAILVVAPALAASVWAAFGVGAEGQYLAVWEGRVWDDAGAVKTLAPFEFAYVSPGGAAYAVASLAEEAMPPASTVRVYGRDGGLLWTVAGTGATAAYVADSGAAVLATRPYVDPKAPARLDFYSATGVKVGEAEVGPPLEAAFFPGGERLALVELGGETVVFDLATGEEAYRLPTARTAAAGPEGLVLLVDREWMALYRGDNEVWRAGHDFYYPRLARVSADGERAIVGGHHEVALASLADGRVTRRWEAPADFAVTDIAAAHDFSSFAVGIRSLTGLEGVVWLNSQFDVIGKEERRVSQPGGSSPTAAVLADPPRVAAMGQGWRATLGQ